MFYRFQKSINIRWCVNLDKQNKPLKNEELSKSEKKIENLEKELNEKYIELGKIFCELSDKNVSIINTLVDEIIKKKTN